MKITQKMRWTAGLVALGVMFAVTAVACGGTAEAPKAAAPKAEPKKEEPKKEAVKTETKKEEPKKK